MKRKTFSYMAFFVFLGLASAYWAMEGHDGKLVTIEANYMQYACGDWNDDMQVQQVSDPHYKFMVGHDIDPMFRFGEAVLGQWFYDNRTNDYGMEYRLTGHFSKDAANGCEYGAPRFYIETIERMDGSAFVMND